MEFYKDITIVMGIHGIQGISKGYSGGLDSLVLYFDKEHNCIEITDSQTRNDTYDARVNVQTRRVYTCVSVG